MDIYDDEKRQLALDKYKGEGKKEREDIGYVFFSFVALFSPQKKLNCATDMDKETRSLNHLVYIL